MQKINQIIDYLKYLTQAKTKYYIHSPFVYELCEAVIYDRRHYYYYDDIEHVRRKLLQNNTQVAITNFGAKSQIGSKSRFVSQLAQSVAVPPNEGRLLFRLVDYFQPKNIVELGTNIGISTLYLANANRQTTLHTIEGNETVARIAQELFNSFELKKVQLHTGLFENVLPKLLPQLNSLDMVLFDGNHQFEPTMAYFEQCLPYINNNTLFVFDDIYWSDEMKQAWTQIKAHPQVSVTIDLFKLGLVFFRKEQKKENFKLYFF
jgi:predicted O-methyltransferase YrrM